MPPSWSPSEASIRALIRERAEEECGSVFLAFVLPLLINLIASLIWEAIKRRDREAARERIIRRGDDAP